MALTFTLHEFTIFQSDIHETQRLKINFYESNLKKYFNFRAENHQHYLKEFLARKFKYLKTLEHFLSFPNCV